jgi:single-strand DNA-binding protein
MNRAILYGNVGKDADTKHLESGKVIAKFSLATNKSYTNQSGEKITETQWHNIVCWGKTAETADKWIKKGSSIIVEGEIQYRQYDDKDGVTKYITEIVCDRFHFAGGKKEEVRPQNNEGKSQKGKIDMKSLSDPNDLPGYVADENVPDDISDFPY